MRHRIRWASGLICAAVAAMSAGFAAPAPASAQPLPVSSPPTITKTATETHVTGTLSDGATYVMDVPVNWNGTVLLYSHGFVAPGLGAPNPAHDAVGNGDNTILLNQGFALIGSSYAIEGWAIADAIPDQLATLAEFKQLFGRPAHTIAWGQSMGGMITTAIAEEDPSVISGSMAMCGLEMGGVGEWNTLLDSTWAFKTLLAPTSAVPVVNIGPVSSALADDSAMSQVATDAQTTAAGRARIALAAALYDIPDYNTPGQVDPAPGDYAADEANQEQDMIASVFAANYLFRYQTEMLAGGNFSWNTGVNYAQLIKKSIDYREVAALYRQAGLSLNADLETLDSSPRISADPSALHYIIRYVTFSGDLTKPQLNIHTIGDGLVPVEGENAYRHAVDAAGRSDLLRQAYVNAPGHCNFTAGEETAAVDTLYKRVLTGRWIGTDPQLLNQLAQANQIGTPSAFIAYRPAPFLRPFDRRPWA
jgi:pimeloyl-ACP methyl ester carboxylesterase